MTKDDKAERNRKTREQAAIATARHEQKPVSYIDDDGCEVTVTAAGHVFYNVDDWY